MKKLSEKDLYCLENIDYCDFRLVNLQAENHKLVLNDVMFSYKRYCANMINYAINQLYLQDKTWWINDEMIDREISTGRIKVHELVDCEEIYFNERFIGTFHKIEIDKSLRLDQWFSNIGVRLISKKFGV